RQAGRSARPATDTIRAGDQPEDRHRAWDRRAQRGAIARRRGDRMMRRRDFITLLGGAAAVVCPVAAGAQQTERVARIGVLLNVAARDAGGQGRLSAFVQRMKELGWTEGHNVRLYVRWGAGDDELYRQYATELVAIAPDVIVAVTSGVVAALQRATRKVPI